MYKRSNLTQKQVTKSFRTYSLNRNSHSSTFFEFAAIRSASIWCVWLKLMRFASTYWMSSWQTLYSSSKQAIKSSNTTAMFHVVDVYTKSNKCTNINSIKIVFSEYCLLKWIFWNYSFPLLKSPTCLKAWNS